MTLRPIDGGPNYFAQFSHPLPVDPTFFPVGVWFDYVQVPDDIASVKAAGINTYVYITANSQFQMLDGQDMFVIAQEGELKTNPAILSSSWTTGWGLYDEIDMAKGPVDGPPELERIIAGLPDDGRMRYNNYGKGVMFWETDAEAARFVNAQDLTSVDIYWFTDPNVHGASEGGALLNNGQPLTETQTRRAANYGYSVDRMRSLDAIDGIIRPIWNFVELGWPSSQTTAEGGRAILPAEVKAAVWHSIIAGARGIIYFNHSFGGPHQTQNVLGDPAYADILTAVTAVGTQIKALAPVLNAPFEDGAVTASPSVRAMVKNYNGERYIFAGSKENVASTATFTLTGQRLGKAEVIGENRTIPIRKGKFSDTFSDGNAIHIYRVRKPQRA